MLADSGMMQRLTANRWDDDVVFRNQARGTEDKRKKEFVNVREHRRSC